MVNNPTELEPAIQTGVNSIPRITDPLGKYWEQPSTDAILIDDLIAVMQVDTFNKLYEYSHSIPTGKYEGKMWKSKRADGVWFLRWYASDPDDATMLLIPKRRILLVT